MTTDKYVNETMRLLGEQLNPADLWYEFGDYGNILIVLYANPDTKKFAVERIAPRLESLGRDAEAAVERLIERTR
jgi:hypothetical protein